VLKHFVFILEQPIKDIKKPSKVWFDGLAGSQE